MGAEIERIVDRKTVRNRVQYLVVWRGFGEESNTWESRMDLVADGYSDVIRAYENSRKDADGDAKGSNGAAATRSPSRGRSPGRGSKSATGKSPSKIPARGRGRPRSNSTGRSPSASRRRASSKNKEASNGNGTDSESAPASRRRSSRKQQETAAAETDKKSGAYDADADELRKTLTALEQPPRSSDASPRRREDSPVNSDTKASTSVTLAYEEATVKGGRATSESPSTASTVAPPSPSKASAKTVDADAAGFQDLWSRLNEGNWLLWFLSVVVVAASLLASQLLPHADDPEERTVAPGGRDVEAAEALASQWRLWLPFLTPTVALLLVLNQRDERALVKWVAIALSWRIAAELAIFFEFAQVAIGAATVSYTALVVALVSIARSDDLRSKATLILFVLGALALALSDSWIVQTQNVALPSRVSLMSASVLAIALSPVLTATSEEE